MTAPPFLIAVPSKGRLQENAAAFFARAGLPIAQARGTREYRASLPGVPGADIVFLSASEIVGQLASGEAHLGVTGEDLLREHVPNAADLVEIVTGLGFGHANVVVAVPGTWIDVRDMSDLDEVAAEMRARHGRRIRVATKYMNLTRRFFAEKGVTDYRIVESLGATEGAPASGSADLIVDITTTGATLAANGLKILDDGVILRSEANLMASLQADWNPGARAAARTVIGRIAAEERARTTREVRTRHRPNGPDLRVMAERFGAVPAADRDGAELVLHCPIGQVFELVAALAADGADDVTVRAVDYVFTRTNAMLDGLEWRLDGAGR